MRIGVIGAGNISASYLKRAGIFRGLEMVAVADLDASRASARAEEFGVEAEAVDGLLARDDLDVVVNLTVPLAHAEVSEAILRSGKHVWSEKPLCMGLEEGRHLGAVAGEMGLRIGCAPDTYLGGAHQESRRLLDEGAVGRIVHGTAHVLSPGMEAWHPGPDFFFQPGGGPILDLGGYYVMQLVNLLGPVARIAAAGTRGADAREIGSGPRRGESVPVDVDTTIHAILAFASGAIVTLGASWDVRHGHGHRNGELYGTDGTLIPQDPNFFGGPTLVMRGGGTERFDAAHHPLSTINAVTNDGRDVADYRTVGLADMVDAIREGRGHRCSFERVLHVTEVLETILRSAAGDGAVELETTCTRPDPLGPEAARAMMRQT